MNRVLRLVLIGSLAIGAHLSIAGTVPVAQLTGTVVDSQGRPVVGASVDCYQYQSYSSFFYAPESEPELKQRVVTDAQGGFTVPSSAGATLVVVKKAGLAASWKTWLPAERPSTNPIVLTAPVVLAGRVIDENLKPVANADVWVASGSIDWDNGRGNQRSELFGTPARELYTARSAADGTFRIENFPANARAELAVSKKAKPGLAQRPIGGSMNAGSDFLAGQTNIELMLGPSGSVEGRVQLKDTGRAIPGARVRLNATSGSYSPREAGVTGSDGVFRFADVLPGEYNVTASFPGQPLADWVLLPEGVMATVEAGKATRNITLHATNGVLLEVTVVSTNELKPLSGVQISSGMATAYSGLDGKALLRVDANQAWISLNEFDWSPMQSTISTTNGVTNRVRIEMVPAQRIRGVVKDADGAPAQGVLVSFHPGFYPGASTYTETLTDKDGRYELVLQPRTAMFWSGPIILTNSILARDIGRNLSAVHDFQTFPGTLDLVLQPGITLAGVVKDTAGAPIPNASVDFSYRMANTSTRISERPVRTDAKGEFAIPGLPQGREIMGYDGISAEGYGSAYGRVQASDTKTNRYEFPPFVLKRADKKVSGQVFGQDGAPFPGANVNLNGTGQPQRFLATRTDSMGRFVFDGICDGDLHFSANALMPGNVFLSAGSGTGIPGHAGDTNVVLSLRDPNFQPGAGAQLITSGIVYDPSGKPVPYASVSVWRSANPFQNTSADARGNFVARWQSFPGRGRGPDIKSSLVAREKSRNLAGTRDLDESVTNLDLHLQPALTITGTVVDSAGEPVTNAHVSLSMTINRASAQLDHATANRQGAFSFTALPPDGEYSLSASANGFGTASRVTVPIDIANGMRVDVAPITLKSANLQLAGTVVDANDKPLAGIHVTVTGSGQSSGQAVTDADGRFLFRNIVQGAVRVLGSQPGTNNVPMAWGNVSAQGGDTNVVLKLLPRPMNNSPRRGQ